MVNTIQTTRNVEGLPVGLHLKGNTEFGVINQSYAFFQIQVGELVNGSATLKHPTSSVDGDFTVALDTHADDNGVAGASHHAELIAFTTHTKHAHADKATAKSLSERISGAFLSIANIFERLAALEAMFPPPIVYRGWVVEGQELRLNLDGSDGDDCIIGVENGFGGLCPARIAGQPANSQERILTIEVNGAKHLVHIFSRGDTGRMKDAIAANLSTQTISTPPPPETPEAG